MQDAVRGLEPSALWSYFSDLSAIPRESGNEEGVRQYLLSFAKKHNLTAIVEEVGNVIIKKPAAKGFEDRPSVAFKATWNGMRQNGGSTHDFATDPIRWSATATGSSQDTSLGADNGIAVALILKSSPMRMPSTVRLRRSSPLPKKPD